MGINIAGEKPLYRQISEILTVEISEGYTPHELLPSEGDLAERFGVNRHTIRRGIDELVVKGLVTRQHGKGIVVNAPAVAYTIHPNVQFSTNMKSLGLDWRNEVVTLEIVEASTVVVEQLGIKDKEVVFMQTLRFINDMPVCLTTHYLPSRYMAALQSYHEGSLHDFLRDHGGIDPVRQNSEISAGLVDSNLAFHLHLPIGASVLRVNSININRADGLPVEYSVSLFRGDSTKLSIEINRGKENEQA